MKKMLSLVMAMAMTLSLAACGGNGGNGGASGSKNDTPASNPGASSSAPQDASGSATSGQGSAGNYGTFTTIQDGKLHMSTNAAFPPYEMTTDAGGFEGIDVEVAAAICDKLGLELVVDDMSFDAALTAAQTGQSDIAMAGITVNETRLAVMDFSDSYATGVQVVIVPVDSSIETVDDLENASMIGTQKATTGYIYCSDTPENGGYGEDHVTAYETGALAVMALLNGQVDCVVIDNEPAKAFVAANLDTDGNPLLKILETEFAVEDYAIGVAKGNTDLLNAINTAMAELKADGTFQKIVDKYITAE